jgi:hypothetical protein
MEPIFPFLIFGLIATVVVVAVILGAIAARKRREAMVALATRLNLRFSPEKDPGLAARFGFLNALAQGSNRFAYNILSGTYRDQEILCFDYHYETHSHDSKGRRSTQHHYLYCLILRMPRSFPELRIYPEGFGSRIAQAFGYDDIDFESAEFSRAFCVRSKDKRFAYDVCNPRLMEFLLGNRDLNIEVEGDSFAYVLGTCLSPETIQPNLDRLVQARLLLPEYLFTRS